MRRAAVLATGALAVALALTACSAASTPAVIPTVSTYPSDTASRLQSGVLAVSSTVAGGDPTAALARLDELAATLADARARGQVTSARFDSVTASMALVRADLESAIAALVDQKPGKTDEPGKGSGKGD